MKRSGFSMIELVFVIVILGVLAAVAVPRFVTTRTDAQVAMARSDIASTLKAIPARIFAENIDPTSTTGPTGFSNWGEWIMDTGGLDKGRWKTSTTGIEPISSTSSTTGVTSNGGCGADLISINNRGELIFDPNKITNTSGNGNGQAFCNALKNSYPSNSNRVIPLATTGAVKF